jgi:hypothetical protein
MVGSAAADQPPDRHIERDRAMNPYVEKRRAMDDLRRLKDELKELLASFEYAYAMGHGCSLGDHPRHRAIREQAADLRARIAELTES